MNMGQIKKKAITGKIEEINSKKNNQSYFYSKCTYKNTDDIQMNFCLNYWIRKDQIGFGWISDLNKLIAQYLRAGYFKILNVFTGHLAEVNSVKFSPDGKKIISSSHDSTIRIWDVSSGQVIQKIDTYPYRPIDAQFSPKYKIIASAAGTKIMLYTISGEFLRKMEGHHDNITRIQFSPDGEKIVSSSIDKTVRLWDVYTGLQKACMYGHLRKVNDAKFSPDGQTIVSSSTDNAIIIWNKESGAKLRKLEGHLSSVRAAKFSPDGFFIASCSNDKTIRIWNAQTGETTATWRISTKFIKDLQYSPDCKMIVSACYDKVIRLWDLKTNCQLQSLIGHDNCITGLDFSPDGNRIASSSLDGTIILWG
ncbi:WD-40 repeat-containing protein [Reticulomyxa filosa]|uniref:WD-40 repeat-containing protein n=1 Tax=Reticulomyxa filosa TaxID=46433 RepID=X6NK05_RETFI|nr:WD-40 repeat-containing protein [Reticulomyxa filosa]|eukprot:ETO25692.1 WD-40 repeat-containing protein [Reticulomyxa filosa]